jgi:NAD(P)-dependent dehydrogenase (short-subunit alcohol dehydrogenase family)
MDLHLTGRKALITGGSKGIGLACARVLAAEGCAEIHLAARNPEDLEKARQDLQSISAALVQIHPMDLSSGDNVRALAERCTDIDILVNNAGAIPNGDLLSIDEDTWRKAWDLKVFGYINLCRAVYANMKAKGKGVIVNIIGAAGERPNFFYIAGGAGNASLMAFTKALGSRSLKDGIRVAAINPGLITTGRLESQMRRNAQNRLGDPERWRELLPDDPPPGEPADIANMAAFLASDLAKNINATVITIDGGSSKR